jgi:hypothetical protein
MGRVSGVMAKRIHPGIAVLLTVASFTAALLILQSVNHRDAVTASLTATIVADLTHHGRSDPT